MALRFHRLSELFDQQWNLSLIYGLCHRPNCRTYHFPNEFKRFMKRMQGSTNKTLHMDLSVHVISMTRLANHLSICSVMLQAAFLFFGCCLRIFATNFLLKMGLCSSEMASTTLRDSSRSTKTITVRITSMLLFSMLRSVCSRLDQEVSSKLVSVIRAAVWITVKR